MLLVPDDAHGFQQAELGPVFAAGVTIHFVDSALRLSELPMP